MKTFKDRYPEMRDGDGELEAIVLELDRMGQLIRAETISPLHDERIARALHERAAERARHDASGWFPRRLLARHRSLAFVAIVVVSLVAVVGAAYATVPTLSRVFEMGAATNVLTQNLGTRVDRSQSVAGYTMTIKRAYADANRVLIAYTIRPPAGQRHWNLAADNLTVTADSGVSLPTQGYVNSGEIGLPNATLHAFDAGGITGDPKEIHLHLTVPWIDGMEQLEAPPTPSDQQRSARGTDRGLPVTGPSGSIAIDPANAPNGVQDPYVHDFRVFGPLTFDITVPFVTGHEVGVHQQVNAGGVTLTLERVVVSPTETRAYVSGLTPAQSHYVGAVLSGAGWTGEAVDGGSSSVQYSDGTTEFSYFGDFMDKHGAWTFTVSTLPGAGNSAPTGTWTFHFTVP
ncbi:MAG TPA: DUF4179 domain-containing protein [Chloroflexota bacterium]|nr:DUF4179 domain-containing protein [Chloroflexota bacterium]